MKKFSLFSKLSLGSLFFAASMMAGTASASLVTMEFNNGDSLADWNVDRAAPQGFEIINNELVMTVAGELNQDNFRNTQGMIMDIGESNYLSIDMYVDSAWNQDGRYGGLWGVANLANGDRANEYPILEFQRDSTGVTGIAKWESGPGWIIPPSSLFNLDAFNTLVLSINNGMYEYFVNGNMIHQAAATADHLGSVILNGYNTLSAPNNDGYQVRYDNLTYGTTSVSAPSMFALLLTAFAFVASRRFLRK
ncbi:hypothetical protein [Glaciecola sp. 1036]|uniref:hypothetical protein n=1 Tax=Alteromonadaceae TaxID=72275 RepID=UPI003D08FD09